VARPDFKVFVEKLDGSRNEYLFGSFRNDDVRLVIIEIDLSILIHSRGIHLEGSMGLIYLFVKGFYELTLRMPIEIESYKARFGLKHRKLVIEATPLRFKLDKDIETK
jgi:hypothetical protein